MKIIYIILLSLLVGSSDCFSQGFTPPSEGKAKIYFARVSGAALLVTFDLFHNDKFIGKIKSSNYVAYECDPGEDILFWASGESKAFCTANLKAGEIYIVIVDVKVGMMSAGVGLTPIDSKSKLLKRAKKLVDKQKPQVTPKETIEAVQKRLEERGFISDKLKLYETKIKNTPKCKHLSAEMFIPKELLIDSK